MTIREAYDKGFRDGMEQIVFGEGETALSILQKTMNTLGYYDPPNEEEGDEA